jgi:hypothetical protein
MMSSMSDADGDRRAGTPQKEGGVLVNLPHTRPQRASARRTAARESASNGAASRKAPSRSSSAGRSTARKRPSAAAKRPRAPARVREPAPRQGFESDTESMSGSVRPPGGVEFVASAAEIVGELAKAGLSTGERLLKDVFSRLPGP